MEQAQETKQWKPIFNEVKIKRLVIFKKKIIHFVSLALYKRSTIQMSFKIGLKLSTVVLLVKSTYNFFLQGQMWHLFCVIEIKYQIIFSN